MECLFFIITGEGTTQLSLLFLKCQGRKHQGNGGLMELTQISYPWCSGRYQIHHWAFSSDGKYKARFCDLAVSSILFQWTNSENNLVVPLNQVMIPLWHIRFSKTIYIKKPHVGKNIKVVFFYKKGVHCKLTYILVRGLRLVRHQYFEVGTDPNILMAVYVSV